MDDEITIHSSKCSTKYIKWALHSQLMEAERESLIKKFEWLKEKLVFKQKIIDQLQTTSEETSLNDGQLLTIKMAHQRLTEITNEQQRIGMEASKFIEGVIKATVMIGTALQIIERNQQKNTDPEQVQVKRPTEPKIVQWLIKHPDSKYCLYDAPEGHDFDMPPGSEVIKLN